MIAVAVAQRSGRRTRRNAGRPAVGAQLRHVRSPATAGCRLFESMTRAKAFAYDLLERESEVLREERIDHGIDGGVAVAQPEYDREQQRFDAVIAERSDQVHREEWQPTENEQSHNDGQRLGRLRLHAKAFHLRSDVPFSHFLIRLRRSICTVQSATIPDHRTDLFQIRHTLVHHLQIAVTVLKQLGRCQIFTIFRTMDGIEDAVRGGRGGCLWAVRRFVAGHDVLRRRIGNGYFDFLMFVAGVELGVSLGR